MSSSIIPQINELYNDVESVAKMDTLTVLLNNEPKPEWVKIHSFIRGYRYLPIDKIEFLLKKIFKYYKIEILREGVAFNAVFVVVRVHFKDPVTGDWSFHDGIGAQEMQTKSGESAANLAMINTGAAKMAFPIAKTIAIKDACHHFGKLFGSDLNRRDTLEMKPDADLKSKIIDEINSIKPSPVSDIPASVSDIPVHEFSEVTPDTPPMPNILPDEAF